MKIKLNQLGQALITTIFISVIAITIISAAAVFIFQNIQGASISSSGVGAYYLADSGAQEALLRLLRDPTYSGTPVGQPIVVTSGNFTGQVTIQVSTPSGIITSTGVYNSSQRKIQIHFVYNNNVLTVSSWKEIQ